MNKRYSVLTMLLLVSSLFLTLSIPGIFAEEYPSRPIQIIVPWGPGDSDMSARIPASFLSNYLGQPGVILNKTGAQGIIGTEFVAKAPADGYTLVANGPAHLIVPMIQKTSFSLTDFIPLVQTAKYKAAIVVQKDAPWANLREFVADAKKNAGAFKYYFPGRGTWHNFKWEILKGQTGINIAGVPYTGNAAAVAALLGRHIHVGLIETPSVRQHVQAGTLKALAISEKDVDFPGVMTFEEQGFPGDFNNWKGIFGRKEIPKDRLKILEDAFAKVLIDKSFLFAWERLGASPGNLVGESFRNFISEEEKAIAEVAEKVFKK